MWNKIKQLFCSHEFHKRVVISTHYEADGSRYRVYRNVCRKCGKVIYEEILL